MEDKSQFAGFWRRFVAYNIDCTIYLVVFVILIIPVYFGVSVVLEMIHYDISTRAMLMSIIIALLGIPIWIAYFALFESSALQATPGKMVMGIVVTNTDGQPIGIGRAVARQFARVVSATCCNLGYIICGFTERRQTVHDLLASTLVVNKEAPLRLSKVQRFKIESVE